MVSGGVLRPTPKGSDQLYGKHSKNLKSEGCIKLKIGNEKFTGILALASNEKEKLCLRLPPHVNEKANMA